MAAIPDAPSPQGSLLHHGNPSTKRGAAQIRSKFPHITCCEPTEGIQPEEGQLYRRRTLTGDKSTVWGHFVREKGKPSFPWGRKDRKRFYSTFGRTLLVRTDCPKGMSAEDVWRTGSYRLDYYYLTFVFKARTFYRKAGICTFSVSCLRKHKAKFVVTVLWNCVYEWIMRISTSSEDWVVTELIHQQC